LSHQPILSGRPWRAAHRAGSRMASRVCRPTPVFLVQVSAGHRKSLKLTIWRLSFPRHSLGQRSTGVGLRTAGHWSESRRAHLAAAHFGRQIWLHRQASGDPRRSHPKGQRRSAEVLETPVSDPFLPFERARDKHRPSPSGFVGSPHRRRPPGAPTTRRTPRVPTGASRPGPPSSKPRRTSPKSPWAARSRLRSARHRGRSHRGANRR
jgi:hypothetical protein